MADPIKLLNQEGVQLLVSKLTTNYKAYTDNAVGSAAVPNTAPEGEASNAQPATGMYAYIDAADAELQSQVDDLADTLGLSDGSAGNSISTRLGNLEATHATKTVVEDGNSKEVFKTISEEVDAGIAKWVKDTPETLDTLQEIAAWIQGEGQGAFNAAQHIANVEAALNGMAVNEGQAATVANAIAKAVADERAVAKDIEDGIAADVATNASAISDIETAIGTGNGTPLATRIGSIETALGENGATGQAIADNADAIAALQALHAAGDTEGTFKTVQEEVTAAIQKLDANLSTAPASGDNDHLVDVTVVQENGALTSVSLVQNFTFMDEEDINKLFEDNSEEEVQP